MTTIRPLYDRVVVERVQEELPGGIVIPGDKEKPSRGKVLAVGPGKDDKAMAVKVGDVVVFSKYGGSEFKLDSDNEVVILREDDIMGIVE